MLLRRCNDHLLQHAHPTLNAKQNEVLRVTWFAIAWCVSLLRNLVMFRKNSVQEADMLELAQFRAWQ